jgi:hypothetical protein
MPAESYDYYLRLLKLPRSASEQDIRAAVTNETRVLNPRMNGPTLEARQEAERKMKTLEAAEKFLLGPEGQIARRRLGNEPVAEAQIEMLVDAKTVAGAIKRVTSARGTKAQERNGTVLYRRATIFYQGVDYLCEELIHKKYEAALDRRRCAASQGGLILFDSSYEMAMNPGQGKTDTYIPGPWVVDLIEFSADCEGAATE